VAKINDKTAHEYLFEISTNFENDLAFIGDFLSTVDNEFVEKESLHHLGEFIRKLLERKRGIDEYFMGGQGIQDNEFYALTEVKRLEIKENYRCTPNEEDNDDEAD
jgi:hypothetical protein